MSQRSLSTLGLGVLILVSPFTLGNISVFEFPLLVKISLVVYSIFVIVGGIMEAGATRYKFLMDSYTTLGIILFVLGSPSGFILGKEFWITITLIVAFFMGLPSVMLLHLNRKAD